MSLPCDTIKQPLHHRRLPVTGPAGHRCQLLPFPSSPLCSGHGLRHDGRVSPGPQTAPASERAPGPCGAPVGGAEPCSPETGFGAAPGSGVESIVCVWDCDWTPASSVFRLERRHLSCQLEANRTGFLGRARCPRWLAGLPPDIPEESRAGCGTRLVVWRPVPCGGFWGREWGPASPRASLPPGLGLRLCCPVPSATAPRLLLPAVGPGLLREPGLGRPSDQQRPAHLSLVSEVQSCLGGLQERERETSASSEKGDQSDGRLGRENFKGSFCTKYFLVVRETGFYNDTLICFPNVHENRRQEAGAR